MTQDHLASHGAQALASRIRRVLYRIHVDGTRIYEDLGLDFKPKWFPVFRLIAGQPGATTADAAQALEMAHPSVIAIVNGLIEHGLVGARRSRIDARRKELRLTAKGRRMQVTLQPVWEAFAKASAEIATEGGNDFMAALAGVDRALNRCSAYDRIVAHLSDRGFAVPNETAEKERKK